MDQDFEFSWGRIKNALNIKKQKELAEVLRLSPSAITEGKKTGKFPEKWAKILEDRYAVSANWILNGEGEKFLKHNVAEGDDAFFKDLHEWATEMSMSSDIRWLYRQIEEHFPGFVEWRRRRGHTEEPAEVKKQANGGGWK